MTSSHNALLQALDEAPRAVTFFIRDDDAGWADERLHALLDVTAAVGVPIDLAVIPAALGPALAQQLLRRMDHQPLGVHQHGWSHHNHEAAGRKCEFGAGRAAAERLHDLQQGRQRLLQAFGPRLDAIFTPPWNRCAPDTPAQLRALGFQALSRDAGAAPQALLPELPVHVDWSRQCREAREAGLPLLPKVAAELCRYLNAPTAVGLMLHHAVMDSEERELLHELLAACAAHPRVQWVGMRSLLPGVVA